jgi:glycerophosphoryl diester phosphodiesterase
VVNVAHRGGIVPGFPENTLSAFRRAISIGVDVIEIDLRGTLDGHVVIIHDETLDRTTNGEGEVRAHTLEQLKQLDAGGGEDIPTYEDVLRCISGTGVKLLLDIKECPALDLDKVVRLTEGYGALLDVIAGVRTLEDLEKFQQLNPNIRTLGFIPSPEAAKHFIAAGIDIVRLWPDWIAAERELVAEVQRSGRPVWTTASAAPRYELERLIHYGVNGILTDLPGVLENLVNEGEGK